MSEVEWVKGFRQSIEDNLQSSDSTLSVITGHRLPYTYEIQKYDDSIDDDNIMNDKKVMKYQTDLLVKEQMSDKSWVPRVIVEAKCRSITTHDAITYSQKAFAHRQVHPYLRYGILIGETGESPLPGYLFRHGTQFDFMLSWAGKEATQQELSDFVNVLMKEVHASRIMQEIIFDSRKKDRKHYTVLHKELKLK